MKYWTKDSGVIISAYIAIGNNNILKIIDDKMFEKLICKIFGHKPYNIDLLICKLKLAAINSSELHHGLVCERCSVDLLNN